jgi:hypothetical protein
VPEYRPRAPEQGVLHTIVRTHLEPFLREVADRADGALLPRFVEDEFRAFLTCGAVAHGCARLRCEGCGLDRLVAFSCKGRGFCPSCGGRRMTERAAHLVDTVLPRVPVRQWVLSLPHWLRYGLAWDHQLCRAVLAAYVRTLLAFQRRQGARAGCPGGRAGSVTVIQRFGGALNLNVHFHTLVLAGVFTTDAGGSVRFHATPPPIDEEVAELLGTIRRRILRVLVRRGLDPEAEVAPPDALAEASPALAGVSRASVQGRVALGRRAGARLLALGRGPDALWAIAGGRRHAHLDGFDLHANVAVRAVDRDGLEQLCRYLLRPAVAQERLRLTEEGRIVLTLKAPWADGTTHLVFEPLELLERLAALVPRPRINLIVYHGVLAPHARGRDRLVAYGAPAATADLVPGQTSDEPAGIGAGPAPQQGAPGSVSRGWTWAQLMRRAFDLDVLACPRCGGRLRLIALLHDPGVIGALLAAAGEPTGRHDRSPPI